MRLILEYLSVEDVQSWTLLLPRAAAILIRMLGLAAGNGP